MGLAPALVPALEWDQSTMSVRVTWCCTPLEVAVTTTGKVPGEVMPGPEPGAVPPEMTPDEVQLVTPLARIASSAASNKNLRRRARANGASINPQVNGTTGHAGGREELAVVSVSPVAISTTSLPLTLAGMPSLAGLKVQDEYGGSEPHWNVKTPCEPRSGVITNL